MGIVCVMYWIAVLLFAGLMVFTMNMEEECFGGTVDEDEEEE